jgi:putative Mg2+ transporter-C (MgtC) family protein
MNALNWATHSLRGQISSPWLDLILVLAAMTCGAIIGIEREQQDKPAGLRTLLLVCLGSALFTMVSFQFTTTTGDSGRVAAQIVTGIGFLGGGAILHSRSSVTGMTTAATIWLTAAIGIAIGAGLPLAGLAVTVLVRVVLAGVREWEVRHLGGMKSVIVELTCDPDHGKTRIRLERICQTFRVQRPLALDEKADDGAERLRLDARLPRRHLYEFLDEVVALPAVRDIRELPSPAERA